MDNGTPDHFSQTDPSWRTSLSLPLFFSTPLCSHQWDWKDTETATRMRRKVSLSLFLPGLTIHEAEDLWCYDWHQDRRLLGYKNTARVGEVRALCQGMTQLREWGWLGSLQWMPPGDRKRAHSLFPAQSSSSSNQWDRLVLKVPHWNLASCRDLSVLHGCIATWHKEDPRVGELI